MKSARDGEKPAMSLECEHGQLARSCNICEYEREIAELNARVGELEAELAEREKEVERLTNIIETLEIGC